MRSFREFTGCSVFEALIVCTRNPAKLLGEKKIGRLDVGCRGDLVLLDWDLNVHRTFIGGVKVYDKDDASA